MFAMPDASFTLDSAPSHRGGAYLPAISGEVQFPKEIGAWANIPKSTSPLQHSQSSLLRIPLCGLEFFQSFSALISSSFLLLSLTIGIQLDCLECLSI